MNMNMNKKIALQNLKDLDKIFRETNSEYWLSCGTLLGFYRENDFIGHDTDTDVCVNIQSLNSELLNTLTNNDFIIKHKFGRLRDGFEIALTRNGVKTDLFFFYKGKDKWYHSVYANFSRIDTVKYDYIFKPFELKETIFLGHSFITPKNIEEVIIQQYGENWREPIKEWSYYKSPKNVINTNIRVKRIDTENDFKKIK